MDGTCDMLGEAGPNKTIVAKMEERLHTGRPRLRWENGMGDVKFLKRKNCRDTARKNKYLAADSKEGIDLKRAVVRR